MFQFSAHSPVRKVHPGDGRFINCGNFQVLWNTNSNYWTKKNLKSNWQQQQEPYLSPVSYR